MRASPHPVPFRPRQARGFAMIEFLMVALILAIGLLGLLGMQVVSVASGTQSRFRGTATMLAHNVLDRIVAEGQVSQAERYASGNGTITTAGWVFIDPSTLSGKASSATEDFYYDIQGNPVASDDPSLVYTVTWQRMAGVSGSNVLAMQSFVVNVQWNEAVKNTSGQTVVQQHYFSVSRNVRV